MPDPLPDRSPGAVPLDRETLIARFEGIRQFRQGGRRTPATTYLTHPLGTYDEGAAPLSDVESPGASH